MRKRADRLRHKLIVGREVILGNLAVGTHAEVNRRKHETDREGESVKRCGRTLSKAEVVVGGVSSVLAGFSRQAECCMYLIRSLIV